MIKVDLPGGKTVSLEAGVAAGSALGDPRAIAVRIDGKESDLSTPIKGDCSLEPVTFQDPEGRRIFWHSASHLMAQAVKEIYPGAFLTIGPAVEEGFYYDIDSDKPISEGDLPRIEEKMRELVKKNLSIERVEMHKEEAVRYFEARKDSYKLEILAEIQDPVVSLYRQGEFADLCRGPHVEKTGAIRAFKLVSIAGAYWRGDEKNKMLTRLYGVAFPSEEELKRHLELLEEARRRDHRRLGKDLDLFSFHDEGGPGLVYWHPKGAVVRTVMENFWREEHARNGYELVLSPHIGKAALWETSGHLGFYKDSMYSPMEIDGQKYYLKPMNCPFHILIYKTRLRSYRDLPMRYCELGTVYRYERSGVLHGLMRVRGFTQDDAHIFLRPGQVTEEVLRIVDFVFNILRAFGLSEFSVFLSTRPKDSIGSDEMWETATGSLKEAMAKAGLAYKIDEGAGVFYGPKIDINIKDSLGRLWQCSTIQVDFNLPERFDMTYIAEDGSKKRTVMIHRALFGSLDRFFGVLLEHYAGELPVWLAPVQACVLTITSELEPYARQVVERLRAAGVRTEGNWDSDKINYKIRNAELQKVPYMLVVGKREAAEGKVAVRVKGKGDQGAVPLDEFVERIVQEIKQRKN